MQRETWKSCIADFVIVSVPVDGALVVLPQVLDLIGDETIVFEVGSTKAPICKVVALHPKKKKFYSDASHCRNGFQDLQQQ
jgi:prephenate dehydrogenase